MDHAFLYLLWYELMRVRLRQQGCLYTDCLSIQGANTLLGDLKWNLWITGSKFERYFSSVNSTGLVSKVQASRCAENCFKTKETVGGMHMPEIIVPVRDKPIFQQEQLLVHLQTGCCQECWAEKFQEKGVLRRKRRGSLCMRFSQELGMSWVLGHSGI